MSKAFSNGLTRLLQVLLLLSASSLAQFAAADAGDKYSLNIDISGTVVANGSCTFNEGGALKVDFGEVKLKGTGSNTVELDGNYQRNLTSDFTCSGDTEGLLQMQLTSASGSYETYNGIKVLGTDKGIVGIQLLLNGAPQNMGQWFTVDKNAMPALQAQLVQISSVNSGNVVSGDTFTASGTLTLAFN